MNSIETTSTPATSTVTTSTVTTSTVTTSTVTTSTRATSIIFPTRTPGPTTTTSQGKRPLSAASTPIPADSVAGLREPTAPVAGEACAPAASPDFTAASTVSVDSTAV